MTTRTVFFVLAVALAALVLGHHWRARGQGPELVGRAFVIDGDTLAIGEVHVRLYGIDAPESDQLCKDTDGAPYACGLLATSVLEEEIAGRPITCFPVTVDHYGRTVASCEVQGRDLGDAMVRRGMAIAYLRYSTRYADAEREARDARRGIWQGRFEQPEAWRRRK